MKATLYSKDGHKKGEVVLNPDIYSARVNHRLLELVKTGYAANLRHGTADTKTRKEVRGGGKKPWRQKGTGRARHGSIRSPIWKGGGVTFGPHPRDYFIRLPQNMRREALISALSLKGEEKNVFLLEDAKLESPKTKEWVQVVKALPLEKKQALCVVKEIDLNLKRASQNLSGWVKIERASDLNAYQVLQREKLVIEQEALTVIEGRLLAGVKPAAAGNADLAQKEKSKPVKIRRGSKSKTKTVAKKVASKKSSKKPGKKL